MSARERANPISRYPTAMAFGFVDNGILLPHEALEPERLAELRISLGHNGVLYHPVIADRDSLVILDGHHRVQILRELGCARVPVYLVHYKDPTIRVFSRRPGIAVDKGTVIDRGLGGRPFPARTSRHVFPEPPRPRPTHLGHLRDT